MQISTESITFPHVFAGLRSSRDSIYQPIFKYPCQHVPTDMPRQAESRRPSQTQSTV
jgi:hypothetical protein